MVNLVVFTVPASQRSGVLVHLVWRSVRTLPHWVKPPSGWKFVMSVLISMRIKRMLSFASALVVVVAAMMMGFDVANAAAANTVVATVSVGSNPKTVAVTPNGRYVYVAVAGTNSVSVIDTASNTVTATIGGFDIPQGVAITPDGLYVYVSNYGGFGSGNTVSVIRTSDNTLVGSPIVIGAANSAPLFIAVSPDGAYVHVTTPGTASVSIIKRLDNSVTIVTGFDGPKGLVVTPDSQYVYVSDFNSNTVKVIQTSSNTIVASIAVGSVGSAAGPFGVTVTPDGRFVYVSNDLQNSVSVIRVSNNTVVGSPIVTESVPLGIAATPDGSSILVALNGMSAVGVISTATNTMTSTITVGESPNSIAISSSGQYAYISNSSVDVINLLSDVPGLAVVLPPDILQSVALPATGNCVGIDDKNLNWAGATSGGWTASWAQWMNTGKGGAVCNRFLAFNPTTKNWFTRK